MTVRPAIHLLLGALALLAEAAMAGEGVIHGPVRANCLGPAVVWAELRRSACDTLITSQTLDDEERAQAHHNRGDARFTMGDLNAAAEDYTRAIELDPHHAEALHHRCWVRALLARQLAEALADCNEALGLRPASARILSARAFVFLRLARYPEAVADYDLALGAEPDDADDLYARGVAKQRAGYSEDGAADMRAALAADPAAASNFDRLERFSQQSIGQRFIEVWRSLLRAIY